MFDLRVYSKKGTSGGHDFNKSSKMSLCLCPATIILGVESSCLIYLMFDVSFPQPDGFRVRNVKYYRI